jgi:hypothetical protein
MSLPEEVVQGIPNPDGKAGPETTFVRTSDPRLIAAVLLVGCIGSVAASGILALFFCTRWLIFRFKSVNPNFYRAAPATPSITTSDCWLIVVVLLVGSLGSLIGSGILGLRRQAELRQNFDGAVLYAAGRAWKNGRNPYSPAELYAGVANEPIMQLDSIYFFYPPQASPMCLALALFPYAIGSKLWLAANLLSVAALVWMAIVMIWRAPVGPEDFLGMALLAAVIIGNSFTSNVVWSGQTSLVASAFAMASWLFHRRNHWLLAGIFFALASFKPQLCVLLGVWFLLERDWKTLLSALAAGIVLCHYPMLVYGGPVAMLEAWKGGIDGYKSLASNDSLQVQKIGLESLFSAAGLALPGWSFTLAGVALTGLVWVYRHRLDNSYLLGILMGITVLFVGYSHDYDYVVLVPLFVAVWLLCRERPLAAVAVVPLLLLLFLGQHHVRARVNNLLVPQWRNVVVLLLTLLLIGDSLNRTKVRETTHAV